MPNVVENPSADQETESFLENYFRTHVSKLLRGHVLKLAPTEKGVPDRLVLLPGGRLELVELKTSRGRVSAAQRLWHDRAYVKQNVRVTVLSGRAQIDDWIAARGRYAE